MVRSDRLSRVLAVFNSSINPLNSPHSLWLSHQLLSQLHHLRPKCKHHSTLAGSLLVLVLLHTATVHILQLDHPQPLLNTL